MADAEFQISEFLEDVNENAPITERVNDLGMNDINQAAVVSRL